MAQITKPQRQAWIDQYRGILFFFVIVFHTFQSPLWLRHFFDYFFLPGFFFLSGYLYKPKGIKMNMIGILNGLLIPFLIFSAIISIYNMLKLRDLQSFYDTFVDYFITGGDGIWFIPCLIVLETFFTLIVNMSRKQEFNTIAIVSLSSFLLAYIIVDGRSHHLPWNVDTSILALFIFSVGYCAKQLTALPKTLAIIAFAFYITISQLVGNSMYVIVDVDLHNNIIGEPFVYLILSLVGSYTLFSLCRFLPVVWYFKKLGQYTLFAFPFHPFVYRSLYKIVPTDNIVMGGGKFYGCHCSTNTYRTRSDWSLHSFRKIRSIFDWKVQVHQAPRESNFELL